MNITPVLLVVLIYAGPYLAFGAILFFILHRLLNAITPERRDVSPPMVWLAMAPVVGQIWFMFLVDGIATSLKKEFVFRGYDLTGEDFGRKAGGALCWWMTGSTILLMFGVVIGQVSMIFSAYFPAAIALFKALEYGYVARAHLHHLNGKGIAHRTADERDFDEDYRPGDEG